MHNLDLAFGSPWKSYKTIHVAGTNGKGSVSTKIAFALSQLGFKTGLYTSPHIETFHERIQIDGKMISFEDAEYFLVKILEVSREATFFEVMTMLAFLYFQSKEVDYAVIETGIGGTLDPTNILIPVLSVITSISYDHMAILGDTLDEIASNKAGIIKQRTPVVISSRANFDSIYKKAFQENAPLHVAEASDDWCKENTEIAKKVISLLFPGHPSLDFSALPPCRFEIHNYGGIPLIFDIAHNKDGFKKLFQKIENAYPDKKIRQKKCHVIRSDGKFIEAGENDNLIVQKLKNDKDALGIFGFSFLEENHEVIQAALIDEVKPSFENITSLKYKVSRPLFIYFKKEHLDLIPGMREFVKEIISTDTVGPEGYLLQKGLIPLTNLEVKKVRGEVIGNL